MQAKQKQWQLFYLGFYGETTDDIDGIWGDKSAAGTELFQRTYSLKPVDSIFGTHTKNKSREIVESIQEVVSPYGVKHGMKPLVIDGLAGPATVAATIWFQKEKGLTPNGIADARTVTAISNETPDIDAVIWPQPEDDSGSFWDEIEHFTRDEFRCKCGGKYCNGYPAEPDERMVMIADQLRKNLGVPITIVSGLRCKTWNAIQGGVSNSQHMYGEAADIYANGVSQSSVEAELDKIGGVRYHYPITGSSNVHFDVPKGER